MTTIYLVQCNYSKGYKQMYCIYCSRLRSILKLLTRSADRFGELVVVQWRGVSVAVNGRLVDNGIELVTGHAHRDRLSRDVQNLSPLKRKMEGINEQTVKVRKGKYLKKEIGKRKDRKEKKVSRKHYEEISLKLYRCDTRHECLLSPLASRYESCLRSSCPPPL